MITPQQLKNVFPACMSCGPWVRIFTQMVQEFELTTDKRLFAWLAQCGYESASFQILRERLSYSAAQLMKVWPREFPDLQTAMKYERAPNALGSFIYADKLGNGHEGTGDGFKYRGGGLIQLTGKGQYTEVGQALNLRLDVSPQMIEQPIVAARTAGWYWVHHNLNEAADDGDFDAITRTINGPGMEGKAQRELLWQHLTQCPDSALVTPTLVAHPPALPLTLRAEAAIHQAVQASGGPAPEEVQA